MDFCSACTTYSRHNLREEDGVMVLRDIHHQRLTSFRVFIYKFMKLFVFKKVKSNRERERERSEATR